MTRREAMHLARAFNAKHRIADRIIETGQWVFARFVVVATAIRQGPPNGGAELRKALAWKGLEDMNREALDEVQVDRILAVMRRECEEHNEQREDVH